MPLPVHANNQAGAAALLLLLVLLAAAAGPQPAAAQGLNSNAQAKLGASESYSNLLTLYKVSRDFRSNYKVGRRTQVDSDAAGALFTAAAHCLSFHINRGRMHLELT
jgi:hypothetical protein